MIKCKRCGAEINSNVKTCPHCGALTSYGYYLAETEKLQTRSVIAFIMIAIGTIMELIYFPKFLDMMTSEYASYILSYGDGKTIIWCDIIGGAVLGGGIGLLFDINKKKKALQYSQGHAVAASQHTMATSQYSTSAVNAPAMRVRGEVLERNVESHYGNQPYSERILLEDSDGNRRSVRNNRPYEIIIRVGDVGVFMIQGETIASFRRETVEQYATAKVTKPQHWQCDCGRLNPNNVSSCVCGMNRFDAKAEAEKAKNAEKAEAEKSSPSRGLPEMLAFAQRYSTEDGVRGYLRTQMERTDDQIIRRELEEILRTSNGLLLQVIEQYQNDPELLLRLKAKAEPAANAQTGQNTNNFCPECGARCESTAKFCRACGHKLN